MKINGFIFLVGLFLHTTLVSAQSSTSTSDWPRAERVAFVNNCVSEAAGAMGQSMATEYCYCMLEKVSDAYPDPNDALGMSETQLEGWAEDCLNLDAWPDDIQEEFMLSCVKEAESGLGEETATDYCACMLVKLMFLYPDPMQLESISEDELTPLAEDCL